MVGTTVAAIAAGLSSGPTRKPILPISGAILLLIGGIIMMIGYRGVIVHLLWFKIKLVIIVLIILNQLFQLMPAAQRLQKAARALQLVFFIVIFFLSSYRPS